MSNMYATNLRIMRLNGKKDGVIVDGLHKQTFMHYKKRSGAIIHKYKPGYKDKYKRMSLKANPLFRSNWMIE